jgi:hypothetical protein
LFFNIYRLYKKKIVFTSCTGDGTAVSDEGVGGAPTSAAAIQEGTPVPFAADE